MTRWRGDAPQAIHDVTMGIESFGFNTAIAKLYAFTNAIAEVAGLGAGERRQAMRCWRS